MNTYVFAYRTPKDAAGSPDAMSVWMSWFEQLGSHVVDHGNPIFARTTLGNTDGGTVLGGYSLISAESLDAATALARSCPAVTFGGGVEIGEVTPM